MKRHATAAAAIWAVITILGFVFAAAMDPFPTPAAEEADIIDSAFRVMTYMSAPVFALVVAMLAYSVLRFRSAGEPQEDGPAQFGRNAVPWVWLAATTALAIVVMIYPGLTGLAELRSDQNADLEINIQAGLGWRWMVEYPESGVKVSGGFTGDDELVLPRGQRIRFNITAPDFDVLHSFWIPAFRTKIDAVPGHTSTLYITPNRSGSMEQDVAYRLQCAELCGLHHSKMVMAVRVVEPEEFQQWLDARSAAASEADAQALAQEAQ